MTSEIFLAFLCIGFNAFFVAAEFAMVRVRASRIQELVENGDRRAQVVSRILEDLEGYLAATQFGITVMSLGLGWLGEPAVARALQNFAEFMSPVLGAPYFADNNIVVIHTLAIVISFLLLTFIQIVIGELVPRALAIRNAEVYALRVAPILFWFMRIFRPFLSVLDDSAKFLLRALGIKVGAVKTDRLTDDELRLVLSESLGKGAMADTKLDLIDNVFDFSQRTAKHVVIARDDIVSLDSTLPIEENMAKAKHHNHTRYPLCEGSIDEVTGLINFKDFLWQSESSRETMDLRKIRRDILFVPENKPLTKLLKDFQRNKIHMAIVIDEFGVTIGLVTLEDVLEELVGEIQDEYDQETSRIQLLRDGSYMIEGATLIDEVEEKLNLTIEKLDNTTIGGAILSKIGRLPKVGDVVNFGDFSFVVKSLKRRRIFSIQAFKKAKS